MLPKIYFFQHSIMDFVLNQQEELLHPTCETASDINRNNPALLHSLTHIHTYSLGLCSVPLTAFLGHGNTGSRFLPYTLPKMSL